MGILKVAALLTCCLCLLVLSASVDAMEVFGTKLGPSLKLGFYEHSCPMFEKIVEDNVAYYTSLDPTTPAPALRLFFHDCFVQGCDGSVLLDSTKNNTAEKDSVINLTLEAFDIVDNIKMQLEKECPETVSCADILALLAVYGIKQAGGPLYPIETGRRDGLTSYASSSEVYVPDFHLNVSGLIENFLYIGLTLQDMVTLSGAHTIGQGHCESVTNRIYPLDPSYPHSYGEQLLQNCTDDGHLKAPNYDDNVQFFNDPITPYVFDNQYYKNLKLGLGLFSSDFNIFSDPRTQKIVEEYAEDQDYFFKEFGKVLRTMGTYNVLTGTQGQIRKQCWVINSNNADPAFDPISLDFVA